MLLNLFRVILNYVFDTTMRVCAFLFTDGFRSYRISRNVYIGVVSRDSDVINEILDISNISFITSLSREPNIGGHLAIFFQIEFYTSLLCSKNNS